MIDANELCSAASRVIQYAKMEENQLFRDAMLLATHVLHTVRPDDDQEISSKLLRSMFHVDGHESFFMPGTSQHFWIQLREGVWELLVETEEGYSHLCNVATLRNLRSAMEVLGIKTKYQEPTHD